jgi:hypothetical protein
MADFDATLAGGGEVVPDAGGIEMEVPGVPQVVRADPEPQVGVTTYFKMRALDSLASYVVWIATTPDFAGAGYLGGVPTPVGAMVVGSAVVATEWQI